MANPRTVQTFQKLTDAEIAKAAELMLATSPWSTLGFTQKDCLDGLCADRAELVGAFAGDTLLGFVAMLKEGIEFEPMIVFLCVAESSRNLGIGSELIEYFESTFKDAANLYLFVSDVNPDAQRLYQRLGYRQVGALADFNAVGQTEFLYRKTRRPILSSETTSTTGITTTDVQHD